MHLAVSAITVLLAWRLGDWKNWRKYHATLVYIAMCNLLYNFIYYERLLWQYTPNHVTSELLSTFVILPLTGLIFLSGCPATIKDRILRTVKFSAVIFIVEVIYYILGVLVYSNGWSIWLSMVWEPLMLILWALHHKKPLAAYAASVFFIALMLVIFPPGRSLM